MGHGLKELPAAFFGRKRAPSREQLKTLPRADWRVIGEDIADVVYSWSIGSPRCRPMNRGRTQTSPWRGSR